MSDIDAETEERFWAEIEDEFGTDKLGVRHHLIRATKRLIYDHNHAKVVKRTPWNFWMSFKMLFAGLLGVFGSPLYPFVRPLIILAYEVWTEAKNWRSYRRYRKRKEGKDVSLGG